MDQNVERTAESDVNVVREMSYLEKYSNNLELTREEQDLFALWFDNRYDIALEQSHELALMLNEKVDTRNRGLRNHSLCKKNNQTRWNKKQKMQKISRRRNRS